MLKVSVTITHPSGGAKTNKSFSNKEQANEYIESLYKAKIEYARKKSNNIQGNDPWFGFNTALFNAQQTVSIAKDREYVEKYSNDPTKELWVRGIEERTKAFETTFGVPLTDELYDFIKTVKKVK